MSDEDVSVKFGGDTADAHSAIDGLKDKLEGFSEPIAGLIGSFSELGEAFVAAFAVEKIAEFFEHMAELGTQTERTAAILGITTEQVGEFNAIALASGGSQEQMTHALERLAMSLQRAKEGTGPAAAAFKALGLNVKELIGLPTEEVLNKIADKFHGLNDGMNKTAIAMALLGRGGAEMIPVLNRGSAGMAELGEIAKRAGTSLAEGIVHVFTQMHETFVEFGLAVKGIGVTLANAFGPAVTAIAGALVDLIEWFNKSIKAGGTFGDLLGILAIAAKGVATGILSVVFAIEAIVQTADMAMREIRDVITGNLGATSKDFATWQDSMLTSGAQFMKRLDALWGSSEFGGEKTKKKDAPDMNLGTDNSAAIAAKEIEAEIKVLQTGLEQKKSLLEQEVAQHKITKQQEFQSLQDYTDDAYEDEKALLEKEMGLYASNTTEYAAVKAKLLELDAKYALESQKLTTDQAKDQQKTWDQYGTTIEGMFNSQLKGLLSGTTKWSQAFKNILGDLVIKFIEAIEKMVVQFLIGEATKTAANAAGNAARTGSDVAGAAASAAAGAAGVIKNIMSSAAETFAGIFGFLSSSMGPAAVGPAAAGEAAVAAAASGVASYDVGTPWVPNDQLALLHRGEAVIPAAQNAAGFGGGGGGDTHAHFNINAIDTASGFRFIKNNIAVISQQLNKHAALNPT